MRGCAFVCAWIFIYVYSTIQQSSGRLWSQVSRRRVAGRGGDSLCIQASLFFTRLGGPATVAPPIFHNLFIIFSNQLIRAGVVL